MNENGYYHSFLNRDRLVHIIDTEAATCEALSVLFRLEGFQTMFSLDEAAFFASLERQRPDIVLLGIETGQPAGLATLKKIRSLHPAAPIFAILSKPDVCAAVDAMKAGATDVATRPIDTERLVRAVRDALRHGLVREAPSSARPPIEIHGFAQLTPRERDVLQLITNGQSNKEAGRELGISPRTIEVHRARVMEKLGARNTADLLRIVLTS